MMNAWRSWWHRTLCSCLLLLMVVCTGCQFAPKKMPDVWPWNNDDKKPIPDRVLAVWTDSVLHQPNQPGVRGFGGRIFFYAEENTDPIEVDGGLAVYVFDADDLSPATQAPLRKFVFTPEQFASHMSKTSVGPSYSVWLPWGEVGGPQMRLSMIVRFEGREGGATVSDPTIKLLPGTQANDAKVAGNAKPQSKPKSSSKNADSRVDAASGVQKASYSARADMQNDDASLEPTADSELRREGDGKPKRDIHTIELPPAFQRHLQKNRETRSSPGSRFQEHPSASQEETSEAPASIVAGNPESGDVSQASATKTEVFDARSGQRSRFQSHLRTQRPSQGGEPGTRLKGIRDGRWIEAVPRDRDWRSQRVISEEQTGSIPDNTSDRP